MPPKRARRMVVAVANSKEQQLVILLRHRYQVFTASDNLVHPGARATRRIMLMKVVWLSKNRGMTDWVKDCQSCTRARRCHAAYPVAAAAVLYIHVDIMSLLPVSKEGFCPSSPSSTGSAGCWRRFPTPTSRRRCARTP